jgi:2,3-diketo-5-methylthiopentyl-1-phosphate enolase
MSIEVEYRFPPGVDAEKQAKIIAVGQTAGTWDARFAHRQESLEAHLAEVISVVKLVSQKATSRMIFLAFSP